MDGLFGSIIYDKGANKFRTGLYHNLTRSSNYNLTPEF